MPAFLNSPCKTLFGIVMRFDKLVNALLVPDFNGDYLVLSHIGMNIQEKKMDVIEKLIMVNTFGEWWYPLHKNIFQEIMIETLC